MQSQIKLEDVSYKYPNSRKNTLKDFNLNVKEGEFILIKGPSGSGKTTLLKCISGLIPHYSGGTIKGSITVEGLNPRKKSVEEISQKVGSLFQDPENQIIATTVESEIAFGLENQRKTPEEITSKINQITKKLSIEHLLTRKTSELSSGEKQKTVLASILAMNPPIILLDEPCSQLDPKSSQNLIKILKKLNKENNTTILLVEHDFPNEKAEKTINLGEEETKPQYETKKTIEPETQPIIKITNLNFQYNGRRILKNISLEVKQGEFISIIGPNGCGKTTLLKHLNGLLKQTGGEIQVDSINVSKTLVEDMAHRIGFLSQNPNDYLFCDTVEEEIKFSLKNLGLTGDVDSTLKEFNLSEHKQNYPRDLSGGERQRVALASILIAQPKIIVLDEPTRGVDTKSKNNLLEILQRLRSQGKTILLATHDMNLASHSDRTITLNKGRIIQ